MESAIPEHLRCPRTRPAGFAPGHVPPNPAYTARFSEVQRQMTMAFVGAQYRDPEGEMLAQAAKATPDAPPDPQPKTAARKGKARAARPRKTASR